MLCALMNVTIYFLRVNAGDDTKPISYAALLEQTNIPAKSWERATTLMGLREKLEKVHGLNWEEIEEAIAENGHYECGGQNAGHDFMTPSR